MTAFTGVDQKPTIAVVGSGPAGCYAAQFLRRPWSDAEIAVFDASPVPYGLVRYGIAPDHRGNIEVRFWFDATPDRVSAHNGSTVVHLTTGAGPVAVAVGTLVTAIGFVHREDRPDHARLGGRADVFTTGWCRRGATGGVAANRKCAQEVAGSIADAVRAGQLTLGRPGPAAVQDSLGPRVVGFEGWRRIDRHEIASAAPDRCRAKITRLAGLYEVAAGGDSVATADAEAPARVAAR